MLMKVYKGCYIIVSVFSNKKSYLNKIKEIHFITLEAQVLTLLQF
jgi:hypothetical protein